MGDDVMGKAPRVPSRRWLVWGKAGLYALGAVLLVVAEVLYAVLTSSSRGSSGSSGGDDGGGDDS
jgi:hypothetical protein